MPHLNTNDTLWSLQGWAWLRWLLRYAQWGIRRYPDTEKRRLVLVNLTAFLATLSCLSYATSFAAYDYQGLGWAVWINLICAVCFFITPVFHRWGSLVAPVYLTALVMMTIFWLSGVFGKDSGTHLTFLTAIAIATILFGNRWRQLVCIVVIGWAAHLYAQNYFVTPKIDPVEYDWLIRLLYFNSATTFVIVVGFVVWYAFQVAAEAEERAAKLLRNILPDEIANQLKQNPGQPIAERFQNASILFADLVGFTPIFGQMDADKMVGLLNEIFCSFDGLVEHSGVEKIKTVGDAYMAAAGVPTSNPDHVGELIEVAWGMLEVIRETEQRYHLGLQLRIGIATGPVTAGVIGRKKFAYDVWAPAVNLAARLESSGIPGRIHVDKATRDAACHRFRFEEASPKELKGIGTIETWLVVGPAKDVS